MPPAHEICHAATSPASPNVGDTNITVSNIVVSYSSRRQQGKGILFGHQHDFTYGFTFESCRGHQAKGPGPIGAF
ncbi:hypothetical protein EHS43_42460 [Streptomyces sp. RP5T]|nr:hypothetical protein EHS43_42460 [Streptomyces sp. RP5T]